MQHSLVVSTGSCIKWYFMEFRFGGTLKHDPILAQVQFVQIFFNNLFSSQALPSLRF